MRLFLGSNSDTLIYSLPPRSDCINVPIPVVVFFAHSHSDRTSRHTEGGGCFADTVVRRGIFYDHTGSMGNPPSLAFGWIASPFTM